MRYLMALLMAVAMSIAQNAMAASGTWANPAALNPSITSVNGSQSLVVSTGTFAVGQLVQFGSSGTPGGFSNSGHYYVVSSSGSTIKLSATPGGTPITATSTVTSGASINAWQSWQKASNWGGTVPGGVDCVVTFDNGPVANVGGVSLDGNVTIGEFNYMNTSNVSDLLLSSGSSAAYTLKFAVSGTIPGLAMPTITMAASNRRVDFSVTTDVPLSISGTQGLLLIAPPGGPVTNGTSAVPSKTLNVYAGINWTGLTGGIVIQQGILSMQSGSVLMASANSAPEMDMTIGTAASGSNNELAALDLAGAGPTIGALNGNAFGRVYGNNSLTVGALTATGGNFGGIIGQDFPGALYSTSLIETGTGTQTISGTIAGTGGITMSGSAAGTLVLTGSDTYTGTTVVNAGTLLLDGTHAQGTGITAGTYTVASSGTLAGIGAILLSDTSGNGTGVSIAGTLTPGDPSLNGGIGTLTINGSNSVRPALTFAADGAMRFSLGANFASDKLAMTSAQANDVVFSGSNKINFNDTTGGVLYAGLYTLITGTSSAMYSGLVTGANGVITSGLTIGSGLAGYPGSQLEVSGDNIVLNLVSPYSPPGSLLDTLQFGNTPSETQHSLSATGTVVTTGGLGQTCREILPNTFLTFTLAVNPAVNNYLTVKLWGSDSNTNTLYLYKLGSTTSLPSSNHYGFYNNYNDGVYTDLMPPIYFTLTGVVPFPGRFYYVTLLIPPSLINASTGTATVQLGAVGALSPYAASGSQEGAPSGPTVGIYTAYSSTDPYFSNSAGETEGTAPTLQTQPSPPSTGTLISNLQSSIVSSAANAIGWQIYGTSWTGTSGSLVGAIYQGNNPSSPPSLDEIAIQVSNGNLVNLRIPSYIAKMYVTPWSGHYLDSTYFDRVAKALDFCCMMQGSNGGLSGPDGWIGAPDRAVGGSPLEGYGSQGLGLAFTLLYAEAQANSSVNTLLQSYLNTDISDGVNTLPRRQAWENLFNNNVQYLIANGRGHAANQDMAQMTAMWLENESALELGSTNSLTTSQALQYVYSAVGLAASPLSSTPSLAGSWCSGLSLPMEPWGTLGGGYDGNYGDVNDLEEMSYLAQLTGDPSVSQQAEKAIADSQYFFAPGFDDTSGTGDYASWQKEEIISTRSMEWPGRVDFMNDGMPFAASPSGLNDPIALRFTQIAYQNNDIITILPSSNAHFVDSIGYAFLNIDSYTAALEAPATNTRIPTEAGQPDFGWVDPTGCTVAAQQTDSAGNVSRLYVALQWRRGFSSSTERDLTTAQVDNIAQIHFTTPTIDRLATVAMNSVGGFGGLYTCQYGPYFVAANLNLTSSASCTLPSGVWGQVGKNLVTQSPFTVPSNGVINVTYAQPLIFTATAGPVVTSTATAVLGASGTSASLSVASADNIGAAGLTYTWSTTDSPLAPVTFSANGTNAAANTTATFTKAGTYNFSVVITDPASLSATSSVNVTVSQLTSAIAVTPAAATVNAVATLQFSGKASDQFGNTMNPEPVLTWSVANGIGSIGPVTGLYTAPSLGGSATIQAAATSVSATTGVTIVSPQFTAAEENPPVLGTVTSGSNSGDWSITTSPSLIGHTYQLQYTNNLVSGSWESIGAAQPGTGINLQLVVLPNPSAPCEFFRILIER